MSQIRHLRPSEAELLLPGARSFFSEGRIMGELNEKSFVDGILACIRNGIGLFLVYGEPPFEGAIGGVIYPDFPTGDLIASELFWYVMPESRGVAGVRLLKEFEKEARIRGAKRLTMMHLDGPRTAGIARLYERLGYCQREQIYAKVLSAK